MNIPFLHNATKANEKLAELSGQLAGVNATLAAVTGERDALKVAFAERTIAAESCRAQFDATVADLTEKLSLATAELTTAKAAVADFDAKVNAKAEALALAKADAIMARIGQPPIKPGAATQPNAVAPMNRAEFNALSPQQRMQFAKAGGRLTE